MFNDNKNDYHHQKEHKKLHIRLLETVFFYSLNSFPLSTKPQTSCFPDGYDENGFLATF